ncbi:MAG TPA: HAD family hydrolase [Candidatus Binatia bacterium]
MIEAVIFDIDGTIVDSVDLHARAWQAAFAKFGKEISLQKIRRQIGKGTDQLLPALLSSQAIDEYGRELDEYRSELFRREYLPRVKALPKVRELFQRIKQDNRQIVLASSAKADEVEIYKRIAKIDDLIESESSCQDTAKSKPHPDVFEVALQRLPLTRLDKVIVVGDTPYDAEAAARANLQTIGLLCGCWNEAALRRSGCIAVYKNPADLLTHYLESPLA